MKRLFLAIVLLVSVAVYADAQPRAIGGRLGWDIAASYQHSLGESNMLSAELEFPGYVWGISAAATYDWIFPISSWDNAGSWNWYAGVGAGLGVYWAGAFNVGVAGRIGVEYNFDFPLQLSVDYRPILGPGIGGGDAWFHTDGLYGAALSVRYRF